MKRKLFLSFFLLVVGFVQAQFTAIPDGNFEQALIDAGIDTNMTRDGQVLTSAIESVTFLNLTGDPNFNVNQNEIGLNIQNLEGIKGFVNLETLWAQGNELTSLDLEGMSTLTDVRAFFNNLTSINVSGLTNLQIIGLNENNIAGINLDSNTSLTQLDITGNALKGLDIRNNSNLTNMTINGNPGLSCVLVTDVNAANANGSFVKDATTSYSETCPGLYTAIPDAIFEQYLIDQNIDSEWGTPNGKVLTADIVNVSTLELANLGISSLAGIEGFTSLERLVATNNNISAIDISNNLLLEHVGLQENQLSNLNVAQNTELIYLDVARNIGMTTINISQNAKLAVFFGFLSSFQTLDVTQNTALIDLGMSDNQLSEIDLSQNNLLETIFLDNNNLTALDVSNLPVNQVRKLYTCNNNITCISVSDVAAAETKTSSTCPERPTQPDGWHKENTTSYNLDCTAQEKIVAITVASNQTLDGANNYVVTSANEPIQIAFNLEDENGVELTTTDLASYNIIVNTLEATNQNPAQGGNINTPGIDFELITNEEIQVNTVNNGSDGNRTVNMNGDSLFEADEFFFVEVSTTDPNITLKNAVSGVVRIPVKIIDNEVTNVSLEVINNGIEGSQNVSLRLNSSLVNNTGADMPFTINLQDGSASEGSDFELNNTTVLLPDGQSSVDVAITVLTDQDATEGTEDFSATVTYSGTIEANRINITTATVTPTIADAVGGGTFDVAVTLGGDVVNIGSEENPEYQINEGGTLLFNLEASNGATLGQQYFMRYFDNQDDLSTDFERNFEYVEEELQIIGFTPDEIKNPDNTYAISILTDEAVDETEKVIELTFYSESIDYTLNNMENNNPLKFRIKIIDIDNTSSSSIFAAFDNSGGTEGGTDTFTVTLTEGGEEWLNPSNTDIIFPVVFSNTRLNGSDIDLAESGDYNPVSGNITISPNSSTGTLEIDLIQDSDQDHEYYVATLQNPISSTPISISTRAIEAKIIDQNSPFIINADVLGISVDFSEGACCPKYFVEEGDLIEIELEAEKGVDFNTPFFLQVTYGGSATENIDYKNRDTRAGTSEAPDNTFEFSVKPKTPDNTIEIQILPDNLNENENFSFQIVSAESSKYIFSEFWTMSIVDAVPIKIESTVSNASESPASSGELTVSLSSGQPIDRSLSIRYELDLNSTASIEDFEPLQGSIEIPQGQTEATISITPIDDDIVENTESVIIKLIDDTGYAIEDPGVASVNIQSEDIAPVTATVIAIDDQASESNINNTGEFQISLDKIHPNNEDTVIDFQFLTNLVNDAQSNEYRLLDNDMQPLTNMNNIIIEAGKSTTSIFVQALDDDLAENDENVRLRLVPGIGYNIGSQNAATVEIVSSTFDENSFDVKSVRVTAQSAICASKDEGGILVENSSGFRFNVSVEKEDDENVKRDQNLDGNSNIVFENLVIGTYIVILENLTNPELNTPSFKVQIQKQEAISAEVNSVDLNSKTGNITVSGSTKYTVTANFKTYDFNFETIASQTLSIPLENGLNSISIEGAATCQGKISEQIMIDASYVYPNPTQDIITILGFNSGDQVYVKIFDPTGGIVLEEQKVMLENQLKISLLNLQTGLYLGQIKTDNGRQVTFKIIKENK